MNKRPKTLNKTTKTWTPSEYPKRAWLYQVLMAWSHAYLALGCVSKWCGAANMDTCNEKSSANLFAHFTIKKIVNYASRTGARGRFVIPKTHSSSCSLTGEYCHVHITLNHTLASYRLNTQGKWFTISLLPNNFTKHSAQRNTRAR